MIGIADTSVLIAQETGRAVDWEAMPDMLRVSMITIGELRSGVLNALDPDATTRRLDTYERALTLEPISIDRLVAERWAELRSGLRQAGARMPVNDSWIAATALHLGLPVATQDADYDDCPGLTVIRV